MALVLQIFAIVISVLFNIIIFQMLRKGRLELQYTLLWIFAGLAILIMSIWPQVLIGLASLLGIQVPMNAAFFLGIIFILCMLIGMTIIVSGLKNKIYRLTQVIALLEKRIEGLENKEETHEEE